MSFQNLPAADSVTTTSRAQNPKVVVSGWVDPPALTPDVKFKKLGQDVHISYGDRSTESVKDPRVVILFGWMDAPLRVLQKFAVKHRSRWPSSDIAIVQSHPAFIWASQETRNATVKPLAEYLVSTVYRQRVRVPNGILLHVISNGGAFQLLTLTQVLQSILPTEPDINHGTPIRMATVFDSTPGRGEYSSLVSTLTAEVKSPVVKAMLTVPASLVYGALWVRRILVDDEDLFAHMHTRLGMQGLLPLAEGYSPRVYIYSETDKMVPFTSVEQHLSTIKGNPSFDVAAEKFDGSQHIQHERKDSERYWNAVYAVWDRSLPVRAKL
ncbi:hypothetical protein B0H19DRAFT_1095171 [Mycena capillaripes]|nr:hypothetical protein B0H19DRAFT_1095171 [Mycena capillaripes]